MNKLYYYFITYLLQMKYLQSVAVTFKIIRRFILSFILFFIDVMDKYIEMIKVEKLRTLNMCVWQKS